MIKELDLLMMEFQGFEYSMSIKSIPRLMMVCKVYSNYLVPSLKLSVYSFCLNRSFSIRHFTKFRIPTNVKNFLSKSIRNSNGGFCTYTCIIKIKLFILVLPMFCMSRSIYGCHVSILPNN